MITDRYRPTTWAGVVGNESAVALARELARRCRETGDPLCAVITGKSGLGKTTTALIMAREIAGRRVVQVDSGELDMAKVREIEGLIRKPLRPQLYEELPVAVVIEEFHTASAGAPAKLLSVLEDLRRGCAVIATTNRPHGELVDMAVYQSPMQRRFHAICFSDQGIATRGGKPGPGPKLVKRIMEAEGLNSKPDRYYEQLFHSTEGNIGLAIERAYREGLAEQAQAAAEGAEKGGTE